RRRCRYVPETDSTQALFRPSSLSRATLQLPRTGLSRLPRKPCRAGLASQGTPQFASWALTNSDEGSRERAVSWADEEKAGAGLVAGQHRVAQGHGRAGALAFRGAPGARDARTPARHVVGEGAVFEAPVERVVAARPALLSRAPPGLK